MVISDEARAERNAYLRAWRAKNRDKVRAANSAYWERKAANKNSSTTDSIGTVSYTHLTLPTIA